MCPVMTAESGNTLSEDDFVFWSYVLPAERPVSLHDIRNNEEEEEEEEDEHEEQDTSEDSDVA